MTTPTDATLRYAIRLERLGRRTQRLMLQDINHALETVDRSLRERNRDDAPFTLDRLQAIRPELQALARALEDQLAGTINETLDGVIKTAPNAAAEAILSVNASFVAVPVQFLAAVKDRPFDGFSWTRWGEDLAAKTLRRIDSELRQAAALGETIPQIRNRIETVSKLSRTSATRLARTSINATSNRARMEVFRANSDILRGWTFVATLDQRTSRICSGLDGQEFGLDDPDAPYPPRHVNCRSVAVPAIIGVDEPIGNRAAAGGPVKASLNYEEWLRTQDKAFQIEALGETRWRGWKNGIPLRGFATPDRELSVEELLRLYPDEMRGAA